MEPWDYLVSPAADAATNMAVDEALLRTAPARGWPLLRVYSWQRPSISIGYFQRFPAELADRYEIVRRPTGGGLVYHGDDTTYTIVAPPGHRLYQLSTHDAYCAIHRAVAVVLSLKSELASQRADLPRAGYECFQNPVAGDVVAEGRKLAGAAQRRSRAGLLHQGSIAARVSAAGLRQALEQEFGASFNGYELTGPQIELAKKLAVEKFASRSWTRRIG